MTISVLRDFSCEFHSQPVNKSSCDIVHDINVWKIMAIMTLKEFRKINTCFRIYLFWTSAWHDIGRPRENSWEWRCFVTKVTHFRFQACTELWARGLPLSFSQRATEILRPLAKVSTLSSYFLSLSDFLWNISMVDWGSKVVKQSNVPSISATEVRTHGCFRFLNVR